MILSPDDHRSLQAIDGELATCEPHLAAMFRIFTRLNADEAPPPSEDVIVAVPPPAPPAEPKPRRGWRGRPRSQAAQARLSDQARTRSRRQPGSRPSRGRRGLWRPVAAITVPAVLLVTVLIVMFVTLTSSIKCRPASATSAARTSAPLIPGNGTLSSCRQSTGTARSGAGG
jgi:hypothetical protein